MAVRFLDDDEVIANTPVKKSRVRFLDEEPSNIPQVVNETENIESPQGLWEKTKDLITGESRTTPEIESLPTIGEMPELNNLSMSGLRAALVTMTGKDEEAAKALQANFPGVKVRTDSKGNLIVRSAADNKEYAVNKPGLDARDLIKTGLIAAMFSPIGRVSGMLGRIGTAGGIQTAIEASQKAVGGEFNVEEIPLAASTETIAPGLAKLSKVGKGVKNVIKPLDMGSPLERSIAESQKRGVDVLTSDVRPPSTFAGKLGQAVTERIPFIGTGGLRAKQKEQRVDAVRNILREYGADQFTQASDDVMEELLKKRKADLTKYTSSKNDIIERLKGKGSLNVTNTTKSIDEEINKLKSLNTKGVEPAINLLEDYKNAFQNQNLENVELLRRQLGQQLIDPNIAQVRSTAEKSVSKIYKAIREDVGRFIKNNGEKKDFVKWKVANAKLSKMMGELEVNTLKSTLKRGDATPELVRKMIFSKSPSDIQLLYKNLTPAGRDKAKVAILQEVLEKAGGVDEITPAKFMRQLKKTENSTRIFFNKQDRKVFNGLMKTLDLTKRAEEAVSKPMTGAELTGLISPVVLTQMFGLTPGALTYGGVAGAARMYESKPVRNLLIQIDNAKPGKEKELINKLIPLLQSKRQLSDKDNK